MSLLNKITNFLGLGTLGLFMIEPISMHIRNMTLGIHTEDWIYATDTEEFAVNELYIGLLFVRFVFTFYYE